MLYATIAELTEKPWGLVIFLTINACECAAVSLQVSTPTPGRVRWLSLWPIFHSASILREYCEGGVFGGV
jgi:hypothetical protein